MEKLEVNKIEQNLVKRIGNVIALTDKLLSLSSGKIKIFIANDHTLFSKGVQNALKSFKNIVFVGQADSFEEIFKKLKGVQPDILLTDDIMPRTDILEDIPKIKNMYPNLKIIINSLGYTEYHIDEIIDYIDGYIHTTTDIKYYVEAFEKVYKGENYFIKNEHDNGKVIKSHVSYNKKEFVSIIKSIV